MSIIQFRESFIHNLIKKIEVRPCEEKHILINATRRKYFIMFYKVMVEQKRLAQKAARRFRTKWTKYLKHFNQQCFFFFFLFFHLRKLLWNIMRFEINCHDNYTSNRTFSVFSISMARLNTEHGLQSYSTPDKCELYFWHSKA